MTMPVEQHWQNESRTLIRVRAFGVWNWRDFHQTMQRAILRMFEVTHAVDVIIDLRGTIRLPAGAVGHIRSMGKSQHVNMPARVIIIGADADLRARIGAADGIYQTTDALIHFVDDDDAAAALLESWRG
jgi:hypothetical protein